MCEYFLGVIYAPKVKQKLLSFANKYSKNHSQITHQLRKDTIPYEKKKKETLESSYQMMNLGIKCKARQKVEGGGEERSLFQLRFGCRKAANL